MAKSASAGNRSLSQLFAFMSLAHALIALAAIRRASFFVISLASMSGLPPIADIAEHLRDVCFVPKADISRCGGDWRYSITSSARASPFVTAELPVEPSKRPYKTKHGTNHVLGDPCLVSFANLVSARSTLRSMRSRLAPGTCRSLKRGAAREPLLVESLCLK